jgi:hypothetical protein
MSARPANPELTREAIAHERNKRGGISPELRKQIEKELRNLPNSFPTASPAPKAGFRTKKSRCCGATVVLAGKGVRREICNACGEPHYDSRIR